MFAFPQLAPGPVYFVTIHYDGERTTTYVNGRPYPWRRWTWTGTKLVSV